MTEEIGYDDYSFKLRSLSKDCKNCIVTPDTFAQKRKKMILLRFEQNIAVNTMLLILIKNEIM